MEIDGRTLDHATLEHIRRLAVQRVREGEAPRVVIRSYGFCRTTIYKRLRAVEAEGEAALASRPAPGRPPELPPRQKLQVRRRLNGKDPRQYGFDFGLRTRRLVGELVALEFVVRLSVTSIGRLLAELDLTPQKPLRRAYERDPAAVVQWTRARYPALRARAKRRGADIFFLDEAGIRSDMALARTWAPRGQTPVVRTSGQRQAVNAISAVTAQGAFWYRTFTGRLNAVRFLEFLRAFLRHRRRPAFLVVDRHPAHIAEVVAQFVQATQGRLELHFLPGSAPDLHPDEFVWNPLRQKGGSKLPLKQNESLQARVEQDLAATQRRPALVRAFFRAPSVACIMH